MAGIARGMCYLHTHPLGPIVHGDLKGVGVLDFFLVAPKAYITSPMCSFLMRVTRSSQILVTPPWQIHPLI